MKHHICIGLGMLCLLTACGDKTEEVKAPPPKAEKESSVDSLLGKAPPPAAPEAQPAVPAPAKPAHVRPPSAGAAVVNPMQPGNPAYDRYLAWMQKLQGGTPAEKQAVRLEIARAGLSPKEREDFERLKTHYGVKE